MIQNFLIPEIWFLKFDFMWLISTYRVNLNWSPIELTYLETCLGKQLQVDLVFWKSFCHFHSDSTDEFVVSKPWLIHPIVFDYERANEKFKNNLWNQIDSTITNDLIFFHITQFYFQNKISSNTKILEFFMKFLDLCFTCNKYPFQEFLEKFGV